MHIRQEAIRGQCRGRPPNSITSRDGPGSCWQPGYRSRGSPGGIAVKRRRCNKGWMTNPAPGYRDPIIILPLARDWVYFTCSVESKITLDRNKDRLHAKVEPAELSSMEEVCHGVNA
jgi:hypothetical protein